MVDSWETQLANSNPALRRQAGVYFTPRPVATAMVGAVQQLLVDDFGLPLGLADEQLPGILEPSLGEGVFAGEVFLRVHATMMECWKGKGISDAEISRRWDEYIVQSLGPRFHAIELMPEAIRHAKRYLAGVLATTGYHGPVDRAITIHTGSALEESALAGMNHRCAVVLGNPPYRSASTNHSPWLDQLMKGQFDGDAQRRSYFHLAGKSLGEKKLWLGDDYVKFFRVAQWLIDQTGYGILALVTNHGYLDNITFRGMRHALLDQFSRIEILDLGGNRKGRGGLNADGIDENIFEIEQGTAIGLFSRSPRPAEEQQVRYGKLSGTRTEKISRLQQAPLSRLATESIFATAPHYFFTPQDTTAEAQYSQGILLTELMPRASSAVVTARDHLVIDTDRDRLMQRICRLRDADISDESIRNEYFPRPRSQKYPPGDTRGWKLAEARAILRGDDHWEQRIERCLYRPFDWRWIYWHRAMVDWPRGAEMASLTQPGNIGLIVRRQFPPDHPATFFFVTNRLTLDGILRNDNRGNETILPLWIDGKPNVDVAQLAPSLESIDYAWSDQPHPNEANTLGPESWLALVYALVHLPEYRTRFAAPLRIDFPRVFLPRRGDVVRGMVPLGKRLIELHLSGESMGPSIDDQAPVVVAPRFPRFADGVVWVDPETLIEKIDETTWNMKIGGHQVARKWLKDRRGQQLTAVDRAAYHQIIDTLRQTSRISLEIQQVVDQQGGFDAVFALSPSNAPA
ncbi:MAG: type ISP restriction/modification enzyme [Pirellulaceae bacterium]